MPEDEPQEAEPAGTAVIIGAGVTGLCAGCYLQMNGLRTAIFEQHRRPGGLCTSWQRGDYTFDGCVKWLLGSAPGTPFHRLWRELLPLDEMAFVYPERVAAVEVDVPGPRGERVFHLYSDLDRLSRYVRELSPADGPVMDRLINLCRGLQRRELPPRIETAPELWSVGHKLAMVGQLPLLLTVLRWLDVTNVGFARRLRSPFLRRAFELIYDDDAPERGMLMLAFQMASFDRRCAGYPVGGSLALARRLERRYRALGGELHYGAQVARVAVHDGAATGLELVGGRRHQADLVLSAADGRFTHYEALRGQFLDDDLRRLYEGGRMRLFPSMLMVSLGAARTFEGCLPDQRFLLAEPLRLPDGTEVRRLPCQIYSADPTLAPPGKTVLRVIVTTRAFGYWHGLRARDRGAYAAAKQCVAERVIDVLDRRLGGLRATLEEVDVATPATVQRYTNNWQGSMEGWIPAGFLSARPLPKQVPGLRRFYMAGQWLQPGGGLPAAILSARNVAQLICAHRGRPFRVDGGPLNAAGPASGAEKR